MSGLKFASACFLFISLNGMAEERVVSNPSYELSPKAIHDLSEEANRGSGIAAMRLSDYYFNRFPKGKTAEMEAKALDWALIGAENGNPQAMFRAYSLMGPSNQPAKQIRALFWVQQAAKNGDEDGKRELSACPELSSKRRSGSPCYGPGSR